MARIVRLTESDLTRLVKRVIEESEYTRFRDQDWGWYDKNSRLVPNEYFDDGDFDEEQFDDYEKLYEKHPWFPRLLGAHPESMFNSFKKEYGPAIVRTRRSMD